MKVELLLRMGVTGFVFTAISNCTCPHYTVHSTVVNSDSS